MNELSKLSVHEIDAPNQDEDWAAMQRDIHTKKTVPPRNVTDEFFLAGIFGPDDDEMLSIVEGMYPNGVVYLKDLRSKSLTEAFDGVSTSPEVKARFLGHLKPFGITLC